MFWPQHRSRSDVEQRGFWFHAQTGRANFRITCRDLSRASAIEMSPYFWTYTRALQRGKSISPLFPSPVGAVAVVANDWCIIPYLVYIFWPVIDNYPTRNSSRGRMAIEINSWPIPMRECCRTAGSNPQTSTYQAISWGTSDPAELARPHFINKKNKKTVTLQISNLILKQVN